MRSNVSAGDFSGKVQKIFISALLIIALLCFHCDSKMFSVTQTEVAIKDNTWLINGKLTHRGSLAEGLLLNVRMVNAVFEDVGPKAKENLGDFYPEKNTSRFISKIPEYLKQGVDGFTISLQGGHPGYEGAVNSAFNADGSLRKSYLARVGRVIEAADRHGAVCHLILFLPTAAYTCKCAVG